MPQEEVPCNCLSTIMLDSAIKAEKKDYPQALLEEWKYEQKRIKTENLINYDLEKVCFIMIIIMKWKLMMNLVNNLLKAKKVF